MLNAASARLYAGAFLTALLIAATPARAQFRPQPVSSPDSPENYRIEVAAAFWNPTADIDLTSSSLGIGGTDINFKNDLGLTDQRFGQFKLVLRASKRNKFRVEFIPINYEQSATPTRRIVFNGQAYNVGVNVNSTLDWKAWRFAYEFDIISREQAFVGLVVETKYTDVQATLASSLTTEFAHARAPIPAIGGIGRIYLVPSVSITGEFTGFKLPNINDKYEGHYADFDVYGTVNLQRNIGAQIGYRSLDVGYLAKLDTGALTMRGLYFGVVARY